MHTPSLYTVGLLVSAVITGCVSYLAWENRPRPMATTLSVAMAAGVVWCVGLVLVPLAETPSAAIGLFTVALVGMALVVQWCLLVAVEFAGFGQHVTGRTVALTSLQPVLAAVAMVTNEYHWLFWSDYRVGDPATLTAARGPLEIGLGQVVVVSGPGFMLHALYAMLGLGATTALILWRLGRTQQYFRKQGIVILVGLCGPWVAFSLFLAGLTAVNWTPIGIGLLGTSLFVGIFRFGLTEVGPIPGETVVRNITSGVFILTADGRINLCNDRARELLGVGPDRELIGRPVTALIGEHPQLRPVADVDCTSETVRVDIDGRSRTLSLTVSPLAVDSGRATDSSPRLFELHDITDQKRQQRDLRRQNERLEQFSGIVSHDLRNPLLVADSTLDLLAKEVENDRVEDIRDALDRMEAIIDDTLALTRQGATVVEREPVDLAAVTRESWGMVDTGDATLEIADEIVVDGDFSRLQQALENLFRNSVEHSSTPTDSQARQDSVEHSLTSNGPQSDDPVEHDDTDEPLTVRVGTTDDGWYVEDTGSGIPPEERDSVFEPGETSHDGGTGFGLAIVAEIVDAHGWDIAVTESEGGGARFEVTGGTENPVDRAGTRGAGDRLERPPGDG